MPILLMRIEGLLTRIIKRRRRKLMAHLDRPISTLPDQQEEMWTPTLYQQKLLDVLQNEEKKQISVGELCQKANVSRGTWRNAIQNPYFIAALNLFSIKVGVRGNNYLKNPILFPTQKEQNILDVLQKEAKEQ